MSTLNDWKSVVAALGEKFAQRAAEHDEQDCFIAQNWAEMKEAKLFSAMVPEALGGGGLSHGEMCALIRELAHYCGSTALAFSMHQHLVANATWNYLHGNPGEKLLRRVADTQAVLVSTGANDWLASSGQLEACEGGYRYSGSKSFSSGCPGGDILLTSGRFQDATSGWQVFHFPIPIRSEGIRINENWKALGMRGSGSHTVVLDKVFIPADAIGAKRPIGKHHRIWEVILTVALPLVSSAYLGVADAGASVAKNLLRGRKPDDVTAILVGEMETELVAASIAQQSAIALTNNFNFEPSPKLMSEIMVRKTLVTQGAIRVTQKALEAVGGTGYFRSAGLERHLRDALAGQFHPLTPKKQQRFTGRVALGFDPPDEMPEALPA